MATTQTKVDTFVSIKAPTTTLTTSFSRVYTHLHPILILGLLYASLPSIIADPVSSLYTALPRLSLLQIIYTVACLPPASTARPLSQAQTSSKPPQRRKATAAASSGFSVSKALWPAFLAQVLAVSVAAPVIFVLTLLHGAAFNSHLAHTALCAGHLAVLATSPLFYVHGVSSTKWRDLCGFMAPMDEIMGAATGTIAGAWLGAIPIPLDWDRDWQKWPVTIVVGAYMGYAVGKLIGGTICLGKVFATPLDGSEDEAEETRLAIHSE